MLRGYRLKICGGLIWLLYSRYIKLYIWSRYLRLHILIKCDCIPSTLQRNMSWSWVLTSGVGGTLGCPQNLYLFRNMLRCRWLSAYGCDVPFILLYLLRHIVIFNIGSSPRPRARTKPIYARQGEIRERGGGGWRLGDCQQQISMILRLLEPDTADCAYHGAEDILMESEGIRCPHLLPIASDH